MAHEEGTIQHVSDTALWVAHYRALESERPDALFRDPLAKRLVGEKGRKIAEGMSSSSRYTAWSLPLRTYVIDEYIQEKIRDGIDLVLNLGAGLDTRPYRMDLPGPLLWIEVDYPHMIDHKEAHLGEEKPRCRLERVKVDLADHESRGRFLAEAASRSKKALVLTEGVIPYLSEEQVADLAEDLRAHPAFQFWIAEYFSPRTYRFLKSEKRTRQMRNAPFLFFPEDWFGFFRKHGWVPRETKYLGVESERLGRKMPAPWWASLVGLFMSRERKEEFKRFLGYVLFQREG